MITGTTLVHRWVISKLDRDGIRMLAEAQQGRWTYETREAAQERLNAITNSANNSPDTLRYVYGDVREMRVAMVPCWPRHFDPVSVFVDHARDGE